jgi:hypothetical protein
MTWTTENGKALMRLSESILEGLEFRGQEVYTRTDNEPPIAWHLDPDMVNPQRPLSIRDMYVTTFRQRGSQGWAVAEEQPCGVL